MLENNGFTMEDVNKVAKRAKFLNTILIVLTLIYFISIWGMNFVFAFGDPMLFQFGFSAVLSVLAVIILVFSIITFGKMRALKIEGGGQLLASSILFVVFALFGFVVGLVVFILAGISIRKIKESVEILEIENGGKH